MKSIIDITRRLTNEGIDYDIVRKGAATVAVLGDDFRIQPSPFGDFFVRSSKLEKTFDFFPTMDEVIDAFKS